MSRESIPPRPYDPRFDDCLKAVDLHSSTMALQSPSGVARGLGALAQAVVALALAVAGRA